MGGRLQTPYSASFLPTVRDGGECPLLGPAWISAVRSGWRPAEVLVPTTPLVQGASTGRSTSRPTVESVHGLSRAALAARNDKVTAGELAKVICVPNQRAHLETLLRLSAWAALARVTSRRNSRLRCVYLKCQGLNSRVPGDASRP